MNPIQDLIDKAKAVVENADPRLDEGGISYDTAAFFMDSLSAAIPAAEEWVKGSGWQPIETAPKDGTWILALISGFQPDVAQWRAGCWATAEECEHCGPGIYEPDLWQPLPALPQEVK